MRNGLLKIILFVLTATTAGELIAQSDYMRQGDYGAWVIERMEVKQGRLDSVFFTDIQPYERRRVAEFIDKTDTSGVWESRSDRFNRQFLVRDNLPYTKEYDDSLYRSDKPILKTFYTDKANMFSVEEKAINLYVNPVLYTEVGRETGFSDDLTYVNTRGAEIRGNIDGKVGFYSVVTENQVVAPHFVRAMRAERDGFFPGEGFGKGFREGRGYDFFDVRGYFTFSPTKHINLMFGKDRNVLGNGERSLLLGNQQEDYLQLRVNTKIWKFQYQNIFAEMIWRDRLGSYTNLPYAKKYAALHYLSVDVFKNLRVGLFEGVIFHDNNNMGRGFEFGYLNPVIFYRAVEHNLGDNDNMIIGGNFQYLPFKKVSLYGQFILSEFKIGEIRAREGWFGNQYGGQLGLKYVDAFGISNLDLQGEYNRVRPYVYGHTNPGATYNHFGQPMAHPLGANFREYIGKVRLQAFPRLNISASIIYYEQGKDPDNATNWGGDIRKDPSSPENQYGNEVAQGEFTKAALSRFDVSYQAAHNLFLEAHLQNRVVGSSLERHQYDHLWLTAGLRWNIARRDYRF